MKYCFTDVDTDKTDVIITNTKLLYKSLKNVQKNLANKIILTFFQSFSVKLPTRFYSGGKVYVDPKTYPDVDDAVNEFAFEIAQDELRLGEKIGDGEFAEVFKGILFQSGKEHQVAVKMLRVSTNGLKFVTLYYIGTLDSYVAAC